MSVRYTVNGDTFVADKPRVRADKLESAGGWDLAPDGRIVAVVPIEAPAPPPAPHTVVVLQNFFDELRRRVGPPGDSVGFFTVSVDADVDGGGAGANCSIGRIVISTRLPTSG